jgi:signal transduction histidine kinase
MLNLLSNAIKFTETGGITLVTCVNEDSFEMRVTDTGPGIEPADQQRIFDEFQQVDSTSTREKGGTGLGLAISRKLIRLHGGDMDVESEPGKGSTFWFRLPVIVEQQRELT